MKKFWFPVFFLTFVFSLVIFTRNAFAAFSTVPANPNENTKEVTIKWTGVPNGNHKICLNQEFCAVPVEVTTSNNTVTLSVCGFNDKIIECDGNTHWFHGENPHNAHLKINGGSQTIPGEFYVEPWIVPASLKNLGEGKIQLTVNGCRYPKTESNRNDYGVFFHQVGTTPTPSGFSDKFNVDPSTCTAIKTIGPLIDGEYSFTLETWGDNKKQWEFSFKIDGEKMKNLETNKDPDNKAPSQGGGSGGNGRPGENPCGEPGGDCETAIGKISSNGTEFIGKVLEISLGIAGAIALILMVIGSIRVLASSGDQQRLNGGREMIIAAVAGLLFIVFSILILQFIDAKLINVGFQ